MLEAADVCPHCGESHLTSPSASHSGAVLHYPLGTIESYPSYAPPNPVVAELPRVPASQRILEFESLIPSTPRTATGASPSMTQDPGSGARRLMISWLPPPDLGEVF